MIFIEFLNFVTNMFSGTSLNFDFDSSIFSVLTNIWAFISYILPMNTILAIIGIYVATLAVKLVVAVWKFILSVIPLV